MSGMTEEEARGRMCPTRSHQYPEFGKHEGRTHRCEVAQCMAWRWEENCAPSDKEWNKELTPRGFCGLAGRPFK